LADDLEFENDGGPRESDLAAHLAMTGASSEEAGAYLRKHGVLLDLQIENLQKQDEFETSHLRWRRFNDQMKGAMQIMLVLVGALIVVGIGAAMWNASQADGLVVDSFSVPPSFVAAGIGGDVVADDMTNKIAAVRDFANEHSLARSKDVREDSSQDIKVEIPETGVSFAEAWRYLRQWLGHEQHLRGNIRALPDSQIALTVSLGGGDTFTFTGPPADLGKLEQQAAERVFGTVDPVNIVLYLSGKKRPAETLAAARHLIALGGDNTTLSESYSLYANMSRYIEGDVRHSVALAELSIALDPKPAPQHMELMNSSHTLGHDEVVLQQARMIGTLRQSDNVGAWQRGEGVPFVWQLGAFYRAIETGDFADAAAQPCIYQCSLADAALRRADAEARRHDARTAAALVAKAMIIGHADPFDTASARYDIDAVRGDWQTAVSDAGAKANAHVGGTEYTYSRFQSVYNQANVTPQLAYALAKTGDFADARSAINATSDDCYNCVRTRGEIAALQGNWSDAAHWFANAAAQAPSIPFAYADWGAMLLAKGDLDGAIAKFALANQKGPHFADPLEMWGEALIAKNRSDLALAKFAESDKYAPNWGRLHLKWGEALWWSGDRDGAKKQFAIASALDLTQSERIELGRAVKLHG
jgi:tetratricopeptide (TPR) repeat protein